MRGTTSSGYALTLDCSYISSDSSSIHEAYNELQAIFLIRIISLSVYEIPELSMVDKLLGC